jgi:hypothetical protein
MKYIMLPLMRLHVSYGGTCTLISELLFCTNFVTANCVSNTLLFTSVQKLLYIILFHCNVTNSFGKTEVRVCTASAYDVLGLLRLKDD